MFLSKPNLPYLFLFFLTICVFLNAIPNGFVYDDIGVVEDNYFIRSFRNIPQFFTSDYFLRSNELSYRPVATFSYFIDYAIWGNNSYGYHLTNVIIHACNGLLFYILLLHLIKMRSAALFSALFFSVHPCVTEAVNAISYREDLFVALFCFLSCICIVYSRENVFACEKNNRRSFFIKWTYYILALFFYLLGLFSKETAIVLPLCILLYWLLGVRRANPLGLLPGGISCPSHSKAECLTLRKSLHRRVGNAHRLTVKNYRRSDLFMPFCFGYVFVSIFYLIIRFVVLKNTAETSPGYIQGSIFANFLTMVKVLASYIRLLFIPGRLSADYDVIPVQTVFAPSFLISFALLCIVGFVLFRMMRYARTGAFFLLCFFVALLPVLNIIPIGHIMAERYLYFPVAGFCAFVGWFFFSRITSLNVKRVYGKYSTGAKKILRSPAFIVPVISLLCIVFTTRTVLRNNDWRNEYAFWTKVLAAQPQNHDAHNNLGSYFYKQGELDRAIWELEQAVRLKRNYPEGHNSLGTMYIDKGLLDKAVKEFKLAIKYKPAFSHAYYNLGNVLYDKGLVDKSIECFKEAIRLNMYTPQIFNNLGSAYIRKGDLEAAALQYRKALSVYPGYAEAHSNLGYVYTELEELDKAVLELNKALQLQPDHANAHNNLGALYSRKKIWDSAESEFLKAIRCNPQNAGAHKNLSIIYFKNGNKQLARKHLIEMLKNNPNSLKDSGILNMATQLGLIVNKKDEQ